jgi:hypothetical protein
MIRVIRLLAAACSIDQANSGFPATSQIFLCGIDLDPLRAGMSANTSRGNI